MKKLFISVMILLISGSLFLSCSKNSTSTPSIPVVVTGYWVSTYTSSTNSGNAGIEFGTNASAVVYNFGSSSSTDTATCPLKYVGTYTVSGASVNFIVTTPSLSTLNYKATANISVSPNTMSGTFSSTGGASGNFSSVKQ
jgi:hypothetical protein